MHDNRQKDKKCSIIDKCPKSAIWGGSAEPQAKKRTHGAH